MIFCWVIWQFSLFSFFLIFTIFIYLFGCARSQLWHVGISSCSMRDSVPRPGLEPRPAPLIAWRLSHCTTRKVKVAQVMSDSLWPHGLYSPWNSAGQNTGVGNLSLLQGIFPTQRSNPGPPLCSQILYQLSHPGSPRILEWIEVPIW